jgi:hypothetical protein
MKNRFFAAALLTAFIIFGSFAQENARIRALGSTNIVPDINQILTVNPAYINNYGPTIQATYNAPIIATFEIGNIFKIGAAFNQNRMLDSFYNLASQTGQLPDLSTINPGIQSIPHLLLGLNFSTVKVGLDLFWETANYHGEQTVNGAVTKRNESINNFGGVVGVGLTFGDVWLAFNGGFGVPSIARKDETPAVVTANYNSEKGMYVRAGMEGSWPMLTCRWTVGANWSMEDIQFVNDIITPNVKSNESTVNKIAPYIGMTKNIIENVLLVVQYKATYHFYTINYSVTPGSDVITYNYLTNTYLVGLEKEFANAWIFDSIGTRGGLSWSHYNRGSYEKDNNGAPAATITETTVNDNTILGQATPYLGFGVTKGLFTLDLYVNPANWNNGLTAGPAVACVTATVKF